MQLLEHVAEKRKQFATCLNVNKTTLLMRMNERLYTDALASSSIKITSPAQSHLGRTHLYPHFGECTLPLRVLAVACTRRIKALRCVTGRYGTLQKRYGVLRSVIWNIIERCVTLQDVMKALRSSYETLWNRYGKYQFCPSLTDF